MNLLLAVAIAGALAAAACRRSPGAETTGEHVPLDSATAASIEESTRVLVAAYEAGALSLAEASQQLADLIEQSGGFAVAAETSPRADTLFEATKHELSRRIIIKRWQPSSSLNK